jgi:DNA-binding GntR family transcriptional regulator
MTPAEGTDTTSGGSGTGTSRTAGDTTSGGGAAASSGAGAARTGVRGGEIGPVVLDVALDRSSAAPLYLQLARAIESAIHEGTLPPGARIENELDLSTRLGLSRPTVRQGIQELVDKGMLVRKRGVGTQVVTSHVNRPVALTSLYDDLKDSGKQPTTEVLEYRIGRAGEDVADRLLLPRGSQVLELERIRRVDGVPLALMRNALPENLAPTREELTGNGLYATLRDRGVEVAVAHERIGAKIADQQMADLLGEQVGAALLTMERKVFANDGTVIEYGNHVYRASMYTFEVSLVER